MDNDGAAIPSEPAARFAAQTTTPRFAGETSALYEGHDPATGARVLVKVLRAGAVATPDERRRVAREAQRLTTVRHASLASVLAAGESGGSLWLARAMVTGEDAAARVARDGAMPWAEVVRVGAALAAAIGELHKQRVVHRDVCPRHVLLGPDGEVALIDAATGRLFRAPAGRAVVGTPGFASPEAVAGRLVSSPADLYGLGATLYTLLAGAPPYGAGDLAAVLDAQSRGARAAQLPEGTPAPLAELVDALLAPEPARRPSSAMLVERRLAKLAAEPARPAPPPAAPPDDATSPSHAAFDAPLPPEPLPPEPLAAPESALSTAPYGSLPAVDAAPPSPARIPGDVWGDLTNPDESRSVPAASTDAPAAAPPPERASQRPPRVPSVRPPSDPASVATGSVSMAAAQTPPGDRTLQWHPAPALRTPAPVPSSADAAPAAVVPDEPLAALAPPRPRWLVPAATAAGLLVVMSITVVALRPSPPARTASRPATVAAAPPPSQPSPQPAPSAPAPAPEPVAHHDDAPPDHHAAAHHNDAQTIAQARRQLARHHFAAAERLLSSLADRQDANAEVHAMRAQALLGQAQATAAVDELREAVQLAPDNSDYLRRLARAQLGAGDRTHAIATLRHELALNPHDAESRRLLQQASRATHGAPAPSASSHHRAPSTSHATPASSHRRAPHH